MPKPLPPQHQSLLFILQSCSSIKTALQIQAQLLVSGLHRQRLFISKLLSFFALSSSSSSSLPYSLLIFSQLRRSNVFIYNTLIRAHSRSGRPLDSFNLYKSMLSSALTKPNNYTFTFLLGASTKLSSDQPGKQVHCHVIKFSFASDAHIRNSLMKFYSCFGELGYARRLFDEIAKRDVDAVPFNTMMDGYFTGGRPEDGLRVFGEMVGFRVKPDACTFVGLALICSAMGDLRRGKAVHAVALKDEGVDRLGDRLKLAFVDAYAKLGAMRMAKQVFSTMGVGKSNAAWSCMVSGYAKLGEIEAARWMFDEMPNKDLVAWTAMISAYSQNGRYKEALELYEEMEKEGIKPDEVTLVAVLSACAHLGRLDMGTRLHCYIEDGSLLRNNSRLCTAVIDMYAKCGCLGTALEIFDRTDNKLKSVSMFNSVISGLAHHGLSERAVILLREMEDLGLSPDEVTLVGVLCACSHGGLIEEGRGIFDSMVKKYGISPQIEHYGCMADLLGRGGYVEEAYFLIKKMPICPSSVIWSALLRNCRNYGDVRIGRIAKSELLRFGSYDSTSKEGISRLIEMFVDTSSLENSKKIRKMMNYRPVWKRRTQSCTQRQSC